MIVGIATAPRAVGAQEHVVLQVAERLLRADTALRRVWPGFWPEGPVVALAPWRGGTLVLHGERSGLGPTSTPWSGSSPDAFRGRVSTDSAPGPSAAFNLFSEVGGRAMVSVRVFGTFAPFRARSANVPWTRDSVASMIATAVHESFHLYQWNRFAPLTGQMIAFANTKPTEPHRAWPDSAWVQDALAAERSALSAALNEQRCARLFAVLERYTVLRADRLRRMPSAFFPYEDAHERAEGIANWMGYVGVQHAAPDMLPDAEAMVRHDLSNQYLDSNGGPYQGCDAYSLYHLYVVGAAKAAVLHRCGPRDWSVRIEKGTTLQQLVELR